MTTDAKDATPTLVVAIERGHDGSGLRETGEQFYVPTWRLSDGSTWFEAVPAEAPAEKPAKK